MDDQEIFVNHCEIPTVLCLYYISFKNHNWHINSAKTYFNLIRKGRFIAKVWNQFILADICGLLSKCGLQECVIF